MKSFKTLLREVAEPVPGDEIEFKAKHEIEFFDDPNGNDHLFTGKIWPEDDEESDDWDEDGTLGRPAAHRRADYTADEAEAVYESFSAGSMKLRDGTSVMLSSKDVLALNALFSDMSDSSQSQMNDELMSNKKNFNGVLALAKASL